MGDNSITLPLVPSNTSNLTEITYRKTSIMAVSKVENRPNQCVVYASDVPPMAVDLAPEKVELAIFGAVPGCVR